MTFPAMAVSRTSDQHCPLTIGHAMVYMSTRASIQLKSGQAMHHFSQAPSKDHATELAMAFSTMLQLAPAQTR